MIDTDVIPESLRTVDQWICWRVETRGGKATKVPVNPKTGRLVSVTDVMAWCSFDSAFSTVTDADDVTGIGFVFTDKDSFVGIDLDDCRDPETGHPKRWAKQVVDRLDSYTEVSPSGTGYHIYVTGRLPAGGNRSGNVECYDTARFFTVTGDHVAGTPTEINERTTAVEWLQAEYIETSAVDGASERQTPQSAGAMDDETLLSRAMSAKNGEKFSRLWRGDTSGYDSHSEADMALCFILAFWTGGEPAQIDRLFRRSGLYRGKWDEKHYADGRTYGQGTIARAVGQITEVYHYEPDTAVPNDRRDTNETREDSESTAASSTAVDTAIRRELTVLSQEVTSLRNEVADISKFRSQIERVETRIGRLQSKHERVRDQLQAERRRADNLSARLGDVEEIVTPSPSWLARLVSVVSRLSLVADRR